MPVYEASFGYYIASLGNERRVLPILALFCLRIAYYGMRRSEIERIPMAERTFDTFIFDLDGTLLDTLPDLTLLANWILREEGFPERTQEEILSFVGNGVRRLMYQALPADAPEEAADEAMKLWDDHFQEYYKHTHPYSGIVEMLQELRFRGCRIGVVSNKLQAGVDQIISICLPGMIDVMFGESDFVQRKPDPSGINLAMKWLESTPERTVYIGDSPGDIRAARNAGVFSVGVSWGYHEEGDFAAEDADPDMLIHSPEELLSLTADTKHDDTHGMSNSTEK